MVWGHVVLNMGSPSVAESSVKGSVRKASKCEFGFFDIRWREFLSFMISVCWHWLRPEIGDIHPVVCRGISDPANIHKSISLPVSTVIHTTICQETWALLLKNFFSRQRRLTRPYMRRWIPMYNWWRSIMSLRVFMQSSVGWPFWIYNIKKENLHCS